MDQLDYRILLFTPIGRDATTTASALRQAFIRCATCASIPELCTAIDEGAGAVMLSEEITTSDDFKRLAKTLDDQPAWSDIPVLMFAGSDACDVSPQMQRTLELLRNVTLLDRPVRTAAAVSMARAALRSRQRQYELRDVVVALHQARHEAEQASRLKDEFLATLSHELRTPLNAILGWTSMLSHAQIEAERLPAVLEIIERNAKAQAQIIGDVLDVSRMVTGRVSLDVEPLRLAHIVTDAVNSVRPAAAAKQIELHRIDEDAPEVLGDAARLLQVCWNLLSNAIKFTLVGGRVEIRTRCVGSSVEVEVSDNGLGLSPQFLPFVFDRFRQEDQSFKRTHSGLGLGLAIVKHLVELHGGSVSAKSQGVGQGATFTARFPRAVVAVASPVSGPEIQSRQ